MSDIENEVVPNVSQTQNEADNLLKDIFGDDDDDFVISNTSSIKDKIVDDDDGWGESDDDFSKSKVSGNSRLTKSSKATAPVGKSKKKQPTAADIFGSDDDDDVDASTDFEKPIKKRKINKERPKRKNLNKTSSTDDAGEKEDSGDEYDSGEDVTRTKEDDAFIDEEDDQDYLLAEYNGDTQNFADERPADYRNSKSSKKKTANVNRTQQSKSDSKSSDPLSETIASLKKQKEVLISTSERGTFANDLVRKMSNAARIDEVFVSRGEPAVNKLQLLDAVKKAVRLQQLQEQLLDADILSRFKEWIEPKADSERSLASLHLRTSVYEMLGALPCESDHLKRSGIGRTVMVLRKHKNETIPNKKILKDLVEKWCRPLFGKSVDPRRSRSIDDNEELKDAASRQKLLGTSNSGGVNFDVLISGNVGHEPGVADGKARVRAPYNNGYVFTVRPESKINEKRDLMREKFGESRLNILKLTRAKKGSGKDNLKAIQVDPTGRDKA